MGLPFQAEPYEQLRARFYKAVKYAWDVGPLSRGEVEQLLNRPGESRDYVFDTVDGFRLIISVERQGKWTYLHVSGSVHVDNSTAAPGRQNPWPVVLDVFKRVSGIERVGPTQAMVSPGGVVHIVMDADILRQPKPELN